MSILKPLAEISVAELFGDRGLTEITMPALAQGGRGGGRRGRGSSGGQGLGGGRDGEGVRRKLLHPPPS